MAATLDDVVSILDEIKTNTDKKAGGGGDDTAGNNEMTKWIKKVGEFGFKITEELATAGRQLASSVGTTLTEGIRLEGEARKTFSAQFIKYGADLAATVEQIKAAQMAAADAFVNVPEGYRLSADASGEFASRLKSIFGGEFKLTSETLRNFGILGLTTTDQIEQFRIATGRAGLSTSQYDKVVNKNIPSLQIFGTGLVKSAVDLERIGVSLENYRATQQGVVTNLEGTLDTVNQLNQLGANIDLETFVRISELGTPEETFRYLSSVIPQALLKTSTSFRALTEQLPGVKVEDLLRGQMEPAVTTIEQQFIELGKPGGALSQFTSALGGATQALKTGTGGAVSPGNLAAVGALAAPLIAETLGVSLLAAGAIGTLGLPLLAIGGTALVSGLMKGDDVVSGYGNRTLVTPSGNIALNNNDTVLAGTNLLPKGSVQMADNSAALMSKIDRFIDTVNNATTTINIDGRVQTVNRIQLAEVNTRYQRA